MIAEQLPLVVDMPIKRKVCRDALITTVSFDQQEIVRWIQTLFLDGKPFDCDPTFSTGVIWKGIEAPRLRYDINPQAPGVLEASASALPLGANSLESIFFDPPFLIRTGGGSIIKDRFSDFPSIADLWAFYLASMTEFKRVLRPSGVFAFKCQDLISSGKQVPSQYKIMEMAFGLDYELLDTFILVNDRPIVPPTAQKHARKTHSYFLVFQKPNRRVKK